MISCAFCERPARYAVMSLGTLDDLQPGWDTEQLVPPDELGIELISMPYCTRHTGAAFQWANSTEGARQGCAVLHGPIEELDDVLREAAAFFADDGAEGLTVGGPWVLSS